MAGGREAARRRASIIAPTIAVATRPATARCRASGAGSATPSPESAAPRRTRPASADGRYTPAGGTPSRSTTSRSRTELRASSIGLLVWRRATSASTPRRAWCSCAECSTARTTSSAPRWRRGRSTVCATWRTSCIRLAGRPRQAGPSFSASRPTVTSPAAPCDHRAGVLADQASSPGGIVREAAAQVRLSAKVGSLRRRRAAS